MAIPKTRNHLNCILRKVLSQCAIYEQDLRKICAKLYLFLQCAIYAQDLRKIGLISPMYICARFAQDCTSFAKICARLYFFPQCAINAQDCTYFPNAQYMCKILLAYHSYFDTSDYYKCVFRKKPKLVAI